MRYRFRLLASSVLLVLCVRTSTLCQGTISLDHVDGVVAGDMVLVDRNIVFYLRLTNSTSDTVTAVANALRLFSPDGANWNPWFKIDTGIEGTALGTRDFTFDTTYYGQWVETVNTELEWCCAGAANSMFGDLFVIAHSDHDLDSNTTDAFGWGSDTVAFIGADGGFFYPGIPPEIDEIAWTITLTGVSLVDTGKTLCVDNSSFRWGGDLLASFWESTGGLHYPSWDGPHCFTITDQCCWGMRGNINLDWKDTIDISDLTSLVGWMFKSGSAPPCMLEADVDGNTDHDIADVTALVGYMFKGGPEPVACP